MKQHRAIPLPRRPLCGRMHFRQNRGRRGQLGRLSALLSTCILLFGSTPVVASSADVDPSTLTGKVMCGYQGWFATPTEKQIKRGTQHASVGGPSGRT